MEDVFSPRNPRVVRSPPRKRPRTPESGEEQETGTSEGSQKGTKPRRLASAESPQPLQQESPEVSRTSPSQQVTENEDGTRTVEGVRSAVDCVRKATARIMAATSREKDKKISFTRGDQAVVREACVQVMETVLGLMCGYHRQEEGFRRMEREALEQKLKKAATPAPVARAGPARQQQEQGEKERKDTRKERRISHRKNVQVSEDKINTVVSKVLQVGSYAEAAGRREQKPRWETRVVIEGTTGAEATKRRRKRCARWRASLPPRGGPSSSSAPRRKREKQSRRPSRNDR